MDKQLKKSNRSKHELMADILRSMDPNGASIYEIQYKTAISYQHLKKYVTYLVQIGLISYNKEEKKFKMMEPGAHALFTYVKMDELLVRRTIDIKQPDHFTPFS
jgi:predicted transcriptional regulator